MKVIQTILAEYFLQLTKCIKMYERIERKRKRKFNVSVEEVLNLHLKYFMIL